MGNNENQAPQPSAPAPQNDNEEFAKKIEQSKAAISEAHSTPPKRGRGRPPKPKPALETQNQAPAQNATATAPVPAPDVTPFIKPPLMAISKVPAVKYQIPELALTDDEATACASALNQVVQAFVPDVGNMDPKTAAVIMAFSTFGGVGFQKYLIFREKQKLAPKTPEKDEIQNEIKEAQENSGVGADNYFSRQAVSASPL